MQRISRYIIPLPLKMYVLEHVVCTCKVSYHILVGNKRWHQAVWWFLYHFITMSSLWPALLINRMNKKR